MCGLELICAGLFITAETGIQKTPDPPAGYSRLKYDRNFASPWLAAVELGWQSNPDRHIVWTISVRHESMPERDDEGVDAVWLKTTWRPFK